MKELDHNSIFTKLGNTIDTSGNVSARETSTMEFKENFNWGSRDKYAKSFAAFSNNKGGYLVFGISDNPRKIMGLTSNNFNNLDEATITAYLNGLFSPEIQYEKFIVDVKGHTLGIIYVYQSEDRPVIAIKNDGDVQEAVIYYRYNARNDKIKYPELKSLFLKAKEDERKHWMSLFERVSKIGPSNSAILDVVNGTIEGGANSVLIDQKLVKKLKFIKEGSFSPKGKPTLKLIGDVRPIAVAGYKPGKSELRITTDPTAPAVREETILKNYPFGYKDLVKKLTERYSNFKTNPRFHSIRKGLVKDEKFCKPRYLDPNNTKGTKKDFYSEAIITEFDKHYTKKKSKK